MVLQKFLVLKFLNFRGLFNLGFELYGVFLELGLVMYLEYLQLSFLIDLIFYFSFLFDGFLKLEFYCWELGLNFKIKRSS
jgi:hypothetical protein